jgi:L-fuconolactonase
MRIDAHHHVWDLAVRPQPWTDGLPALRRSFGLAELAPQLAAAHVDGTVVVHTVASLAETHELLALAAAWPQILGVVGWLDLEAADLAETIGTARTLLGGDRLVGVRHQLQEEPDPHWLDRPAVRRGLQTLAQHGLAYDLVVSPEQLPVATRAVADLPEVRFVLDHAGKPPIASGDLDAWRGDLARLAGYENVAVKLSGLVTEADWTGWTLAQLRPVAETVLDLFGAERTMFGSDWPVSLLAGADYARVVDDFAALVAGLGEAEQAQVWAGTARTAYGLEAR